MKDRFINGHVQRRADQVRIGDRIDLEDDKYADPNGTNEEFPFEFATVTRVERETDQCVLIETTQGSFGFPPDHWIDVDGEQARGEA